MGAIKDGIEACLEVDGWEVESAVERHQESPTFAIPDEQERIHLRAGQRAKLLVLFEQEAGAGSADGAAERLIQCERLWVKVMQVESHSYVGVLESRPISLSVLKAGDQIRFAPEHVAAVLNPRMSLARRLLGLFRFKRRRGDRRAG
jgi:hypothetical protein